MDQVFLPWLVEVGIISVRDLVGAHRLPLPSELLATFVVFGTLGMASESATLKGPAVATGWGIVVATLLSSKIDFLKPVGDFFAGTTSSGGTAAPLAPAGAGTPAGAGASH